MTILGRALTLPQERRSDHHFEIIVTVDRLVVPPAVGMRTGPDPVDVRLDLPSTPRGEVLEWSSPNPEASDAETVRPLREAVSDKIRTTLLAR